MKYFFKFTYLLFLYFLTIIFYYIYYSFINQIEKHDTINEIVFINLICFILIFVIYKFN